MRTLLLVAIAGISAMTVEGQAHSRSAPAAAPAPVAVGRAALVAPAHAVPVGHPRTAPARAVVPNAPPPSPGQRSLVTPYRVPPSRGPFLPGPELHGYDNGLNGINVGAYNVPNRGGRQGNYGVVGGLGFGYVAPYPYPVFDPDGYYAGGTANAVDTSQGSVPTDSSGVSTGDLQQQVQRLSDEVDRLHNDRATSSQSQQQPSDVTQSQASVPDVSDEPSQPQLPPITIVLKDGKQMTVQNYAIMGQTFWDFTSKPTHQIPLSKINLKASIAMTQANGGEFPQLQPVK